jgi:hypothetical protein
MKTGPFIQVRDPRQCGNTIPIRDAVGSGIIIEHLCVEPKGHDGPHRDQSGNVWVNTEWLYRERGL